MEKTYKVYCHTCPNGKVYIGITGQNEKLRWNCGNGYATQFFGKAVKKYGWKNIKHEILFTYKTLEEAYEKEKELIKRFDAMNPEHGYNCDEGGKGCAGRRFSEEDKNRQREVANKLWANEETRGKLLKHLHDLNKSRTGVPRKPESNRKTALALGKKVSQYSVDGEFVATHLTMMDAARSVGQDECSGIVACCKKKTATAHGFIWRYADEELDYQEYLDRVERRIKLRGERAIANSVRNCIPVNQLDFDGNIICTYSSMKEAGEKTGIDKNNIGRCCNGYLKHAGNYVWRKAI